MVAISQAKHLPDDLDDAFATNRCDPPCKLPREYEIGLGSTRVHGLHNVVLSTCNINVVLFVQNIQIQKVTLQSGLDRTKFRNVKVK